MAGLRWCVDGCEGGEVEEKKGIKEVSVYVGECGDEESGKMWVLGWMWVGA